MKRYVFHVTHSWKALLLIASVFQLITLFYVVFSLLKGTFEPAALLKSTAFVFAGGFVVSLISAWYGISAQDRVKGLLATIEWKKIGGNFRLIDEYKNGWGRSIVITGTYQSKKIKIQYGRERRAYLLIFLVELERNFYEQAATMKFTRDTREKAIAEVLDKAIAASKDSKFGEIYWELKRRRERNRLR